MEEFTRRHPRKHAIPVVRIVGEIDNGLENAENDIKTRIGELVTKIFPLSLNWRHEIHPLVVGRTLERAGLFRLTLPFYEAVANHTSISRDLRKWAWGRWSRTKVQQAALQGNRKGLEEAKEKAATYGFVTPDNIPENLPSPLPNIDESALKPAESPDAVAVPQTPSNFNEQSALVVPAADSFSPPESESGRQDFGKTIQMGILDIRVFPDGQRINITHSKTGEVLWLYPSKGSAQLDATAIDIADGATLKGLPGHWPLEVCLDRVARGKVDLIFADGFELSVPVAKRQ